MEKGIKLTGLWRKTDKNGNEYFTGTLNGSVRIAIFPNGYKTEEKHPDMIVYLTPNEKREQQQRGHEEYL